MQTIPRLQKLRYYRFSKKHYRKYLQQPGFDPNISPDTVMIAAKPA
jgi:hypothetical protein